MTTLEALDAACKFKVGEIVAAVAQAFMIDREDAEKWYAPKPQALQIVERYLQQCPGGFQVHYAVRPHSSTGFTKEFFELNEVELMAYPAKEPKA